MARGNCSAVQSCRTEWPLAAGDPDGAPLALSGLLENWLAGGGHCARSYPSVVFYADSGRDHGRIDRDRPEMGVRLSVAYLWI